MRLTLPVALGLAIVSYKLYHQNIGLIAVYVFIRAYKFSLAIVMRLKLGKP